MDSYNIKKEKGGATVFDLEGCPSYYWLQMNPIQAVCTVGLQMCVCVCVCGYIIELPDKIQPVQLDFNFRETKNFS